MAGYSEGSHDSPVDVNDRLQRVGSKYQAAAPAVADGDNVYLLVDAAGRTIVKQQYVPDTFKMVDAVAITAGTPATIWTPASGKKVRLLGWRLSVSAAAALEFQDSAAAGTVITQSPLLAIAGIDVAENIGEGVALASVDNTLDLDVTATATVSGMVWGIEE